MRLVLLGNLDDARGFRLAGVETIVCRTRDDVDRAVAGLLAEGNVGAVLVSEAVYRLAPGVLTALQDRPQWPIVLVLPEDGADGRRVA